MLSLIPVFGRPFVQAFVPTFVGGMPGGLELIIIFFIMFLLFGVPVALALLLGYRYVKGQSETDSREERIAELESELAELRDAVETGSSTDTSPGSSTDTFPSSSTDTPPNAAETREVRDDE